MSNNKSRRKGKYKSTQSKAELERRKQIIDEYVKEQEKQRQEWLREQAEELQSMRAEVLSGDVVNTVNGQEIRHITVDEDGEKTEYYAFVGAENDRPRYYDNPESVAAKIVEADKFNLKGIHARAEDKIRSYRHVGWMDAEHGVSQMVLNRYIKQGWVERNPDNPNLIRLTRAGKMYKNKK